jgi:predicted nucleic acid-binding protein
MQQGLVVSLDAALALQAARLSLQTALPMADAMILATAYRFRAILWTQDADFERLHDVRYTRRKGQRPI